MRKGRSSARSSTSPPFFAARTFADVEDLNAQFRRWRDEVAHRRPHPEQRDRSVTEAFAEKQPRLLPLPAHPFETEVMRTVVSGKTPYVRFDRKSYSIPHTHVRRPLTPLASPTTVRIIAGTEEIARQARSYGPHRARSACRRPRRGPRAKPIRRLRATGSVRRCRRSPRCSSAWRTRGESLRLHVARLLALLDDYGPQELGAAIERALAPVRFTVRPMIQALQTAQNLYSFRDQPLHDSSAPGLL
jgi:hypothetical protein